MRRSVPHYTCRKNEESGITCVKTIIDRLKGVGIFEKKIKDLSSFADEANYKLTKNSPWKTPIIYDLAIFANESDADVLVVKEKDSHIKDPVKKIEEYSKKIREDCIKKGVKEKIDEKIAESFMNDLEQSPLLIFMNANSLFKQLNAGMTWLIVLEYNGSLDEFVIYDPLYYTRLPKSKYWERINNTPKKRYISFKRNFFFDCWNKTAETMIYSTERITKEGIRPFIREYLCITNKDIQV